MFSAFIPCSTLANIAEPAFAFTTVDDALVSTSSRSSSPPAAAAAGLGLVAAAVSPGGVKLNLNEGAGAAASLPKSPNGLPGAEEALPEKRAAVAGPAPPGAGAACGALKVNDGLEPPVGGFAAVPGASNLKTDVAPPPLTTAGDVWLSCSPPPAAVVTLRYNSTSWSFVTRFATLVACPVSFWAARNSASAFSWSQVMSILLLTASPLAAVSVQGPIFKIW